MNISDQFKPTGNIQFIKDSRKMMAYRGLTDEQPVTNVLVFKTLCHKHHDLTLAISQPAEQRATTAGVEGYSRLAVRNQTRQRSSIEPYFIRFVNSFDSFLQFRRRFASQNDTARPVPNHL